MRPAVFLDRDGTIIEDTGYPADPAGVRLLPGAGEALARLTAAGWLLIVVTNQSGIARGLLSEDQYRAVERRVDQLVEAGGGRIAAHYFCPHLPEITGPCACRKPGTALYLAARDRFDLDFRQSWWIGDRNRDVEPARVLGGRAILLAREGAGLPDEHRAVRPDLAAAASLVLGGG